MLNPDKIKELIDADRASKRRRQAEIGQRYYDGEHDILQYRMFFFNDDGILEEDHTRTNTRIPHPYFKELADQLEAYMLSFDEHPIRARESLENRQDLQDLLDTYFDEAFWDEVGELISGAYVKGCEYLFAYVGEDDRLVFEVADSMGVVEVREKDTDAGVACYIYWYVDRVTSDGSKIIRIQVHTADDVTYYVRHGETGKIELDDSYLVNPLPSVIYRDAQGNLAGRSLGFLPFWRLPNNKRLVSGLNPIKRLIDDYDITKCGLSNNLADFDHPIYAVKGFEGDNLDELATNLRTKKTIGTGENGGVEILTSDIPYEARQANLAEDEKNIYRFGMGFNSAQTGDGNITNVVIRSRYTLLDLKADKLEKRLKKLLKQVVKVVLDEINAQHGTAYQPSDVVIGRFERVMPTNETEIVDNDLKREQTRNLAVTTILNAAANIGDEAVLAALCDALDLDLETIQDQLKEAEQSTPEAALGLLGGVTTNEQEAEAGPAGAAG